MKHIYIVDEHQSSKQNGVGTYICQLLKCFEGNEYDVNLISFNSDEAEFKVEQRPFYTEYHFPRCGNRGFLYLGSLSLSILRLYVKDNSNNIFIINHFPCDKFLLVLKRQFPKSRTIFVIHDQCWCAPLLGDVNLFRRIMSAKRIPPKEYSFWHHIRETTSLEKHMYQIVDDVIALSSTTYELLMDVYKVPEKKIHLIPNGLQLSTMKTSMNEVNAIRKKLGIDEKEVVLLYTGRTTKAKGIIPLLQAFDRAWLENRKLRLVIAGQVFSLNEFAQQTPNSNAHITYTGLLPKEQLAKWYQIADIGILPSYTEQSSYTGIEMLAYGKLIVSTDGNNLRDMFSNETSIIAEIGNQRMEQSITLVNSLFNAIKSALAFDDKERYRLQERAREHFYQSYSFNNWKATYSRLINK